MRRQLLAQERHRHVDHILVGDGVDQTDLRADAGSDGCTGNHHRQGLPYADEAWQALRAAGARQDAERDFRETQLRSARRDAPVAAQRKLQAASERKAMNGRHDRLVERLDQGGDVGGIASVGERARCGLKLADVGPGTEGTALSRDDDTPHAGIVA